MSIRWKLTVRFVAQLLFAGLLLMALAVLSFQWTMNELTRIEAERQFGQAGVQQLIQTLKVENGRIVFDAKLLEKYARAADGCSASTAKAGSPTRSIRRRTFPTPICPAS
ncbi:hypothetical protein PACILC2_20930 [Paenibacillus cisolokensis]|uniref:Single cache domain-containing protein n=1 Tax=Paenibacillus cisolokensis TaxID=1658519 RepID=A0ABQ4N5M6_9BACL|nr:hypothetical protein [Paenibacillus cisolokensis]GIQ63525.1 hypothetical protein PACILC2_20930 [Paenibacillus cisolokensis]